VVPLLYHLYVQATQQQQQCKEKQIQQYHLGRLLALVVVVLVVVQCRQLDPLEQCFLSVMIEMEQFGVHIHKYKILWHGITLL
jgi:hypothetical protein